MTKQNGRCKFLSVNCFLSLLLRPFGVRRSDGERVGIRQSLPQHENPSPALSLNAQPIYRKILARSDFNFWRPRKSLSGACLLLPHCQSSLMSRWVCRWQCKGFIEFLSDTRSTWPPRMMKIPDKVAPAVTGSVRWDGPDGRNVGDFEFRMENFADSDDVKCCSPAF